MKDPEWAAKLQAVFELSPTVLTVTGLDDGRIIEVNEAFLRVTGYSRDEVIGRLVAELGVWVDPSQREKGVVALRAGHSIRDVEARFRTKSGDEIVAITNADVIVILPGVDGYAQARMARQTPQARGTCLVALTGYGQAEDQRRALASGFDAHLAKPVDPARLEAFLAGR